MNRGRPLFILFFSYLMISLTAGCTTLPVTGRKQFNLIPAGQLISISNNQFDQIIENAELSNNYADIKRVNDVGDNIATAAERFVLQNMPGKTYSFNWDFKLIKNDSVINAFCLSGGKVGVYTGMLKVAINDDSLATVIAHEVAHSILNHHGERMSHILMVQLGGISLNEALKNKPEQTQQLTQLAYGLGTNIGFVLPYSRVQEYEADRIGLLLMAMAGYDPSAAVLFWERMKQAGDLMPVEFLSTHPTPDNRINEIKKMIPEVRNYYKAVPSRID